MRRTKEDAEQTRLAILDAAEQVFCSEGVVSATLEKISRAAGVTRGAFYWHFKDKCDLLHALHTRYAPAQKQVILAAALEGHDNPLQLLEDSGLEMIAIFERDERQQRLFQIMQGFIPIEGTSNWLEEYNSEMFTAITQLTCQARENGTLSPQFTPQEAAVMLMSAMSGLIGEWLRSGKAFTLSECGAKFLRCQIGLLRRGADAEPALA